MKKKLIRDVRLQLGLDQVDMAKYMGMTQSSLSRLETGVRKETRLQANHLLAMEILSEHGLMDILHLRVWKYYNQKDPKNEIVV